MQQCRLLLMRHAKSSWNDAPEADFDRTLSGRGRRACRLMADYMNAHALLPDLILCSSAQRTRETLAGLVTAFSHDHRILLTRRLYDTSQSDGHETIRNHGGTAKTLMLIGHNPSVQQMALDLAIEGDPAQLAAIETKYPTAALTVLDFEVNNWSELRSQMGRILNFVRPRDIDQIPANQADD